MSNPPTDWNLVQAGTHAPPAIVDPRRRMRACLYVFVALLIAFFARAIFLEASQGEAFRQAALAPKRKEISLPAPRGRILSRDGVVLACERPLHSLAVDYRFLEEPPDRAWLMSQARLRLPKAARRNDKQLALAEEAVLRERRACRARMASLCGITIEAWMSRAAEVQQRVERIASAVERAHEGEAVSGREATVVDESFWSKFQRNARDLFRPARDAAPTVIAEQFSAQVVVDDVPQEVVAMLAEHAGEFPGMHIVPATRRSCPCGTLAAHVIGYLDAGGLTGVERQCEAALRGIPGTMIVESDQAGRVLKSRHTQEPQAGSDVVLTLDSRLQRAAEELLDAALARKAMQGEAASGKRTSASGAIVVMDVRDGSLIALASSPRYDPAVFAGGDSSTRSALLQAKNEPLFHRALQMALPPGSLFKPVTAIAMIEAGQVNPMRPFFCQGFLEHADRDRCAIYIQQGVGHGDITMPDALARGCNVYFQYGASLISPESFVDWATRSGFGQRTGIDLPGEAAGNLPGRSGRPLSAEAMREVAAGRGSVTVTPLEMARFMAAIAAGGSLVTPHVLQSTNVPPEPVRGLSRSTIAVIQSGMLAATSEAGGVAHASVSTDITTVAGLPAEAWFAGYFPADRPRFAIVVAIEPSADLATIICPVVRRLVLQMETLGLLGS